MSEMQDKFLGKAEIELMKYGTAINEILKSVIPLFDGILDQGIKPIKKLVGMRREVADIQRKGRADYIKVLMEAGMASTSAVAILQQELEQEHAGFFKSLEAVGSLGPLLFNTISAMCTSQVSPFGQFFSRGPSPKPPEGN